MNQNNPRARRRLGIRKTSISCTGPLFVRGGQGRSGVGVFDYAKIIVWCGILAGLVAFWSGLYVLWFKTGQ